MPACAKRRPSAHNLRSWKSLRRWERNRVAWERDRAAGVGGWGSHFWERLARRALRPYNVAAIVSPHEPGFRGWRSPGACHAVLGIVCLAWALDRRHRVLVAKLDRLAQVVGLGRSTIQRALDDLVKSGAIERRHHFERVVVEGAQRHAQLECTYLPAGWLRDRLRAAKNGRTSQAVHREQATASQSGRRIEGVACRRRGLSAEAPDGEGAAQVVRMLEKRGLLAVLQRRPDRPPAPNPSAPTLATASCAPLTEVERLRLADQLGVSGESERRARALAIGGEL